MGLLFDNKEHALDFAGDIADEILDNGVVEQHQRFIHSLTEATAIFCFSPLDIG